MTIGDQQAYARSAFDIPAHGMTYRQALIKEIAGGYAANTRLCECGATDEQMAKGAIAFTDAIIKRMEEK